MLAWKFEFSKRSIALILSLLGVLYAGAGGQVLHAARAEGGWAGTRGRGAANPDGESRITADTLLIWYPVHAKNNIAGRIVPFLVLVVLGFWDKHTVVCPGAMPDRRDPLPG